jgi:hypothetical protein
MAFIDSRNISDVFRYVSTILREKKCVYIYIIIINNSVALVRERTIPTERPPPVGEVYIYIYLRWKLLSANYTVNAKKK